MSYWYADRKKNRSYFLHYSRKSNPSLWKSRILWLFLIYHNLYWGWLPWDSHFLPTFISIPQHILVSVGLSIMPCSTVSFLASSTRYLHISHWVLFFFLLPDPSRASLVRYSLCKLNIISDIEHPFLTSLPLFTRLVSPSSLLF